MFLKICRNQKLNMRLGKLMTASLHEKEEFLLLLQKCLTGVQSCVLGISDCQGSKEGSQDSLS